MVTFGSQQINGHDSRNLSSDSVTVVHFDGANFYAQDDSFLIETNSANIATNTTNIATNTANIAINDADITTNTNDIATNTLNIAGNTTSIATNTTNIATNTSDITTLKTDVDALELDALPNAIVRTQTSVSLTLGESDNRRYYIARSSSSNDRTWNLPTAPDNGWSVNIENQLSHSNTLTINPTASGTPDSDDPKFYFDLDTSMDTVTVEQGELLKFIYDTSVANDRWIVINYDYRNIQRLLFPDITTIANNDDNIGLSNNGDYIYVSNTAVNDIQIDNFSSAEAGWHCWVINDTGENVRISTDGTELINGGATLFLAPGDSTEIIYDGSNFYSTTRGEVVDRTTGDSRGIGARHGGSRQIINNDDLDKQALLPDPDDIFDGWLVVIQNDGDNWMYVRRHGDDTTSRIVRDDLASSRETNALMRERQANQYTYLAIEDRFILTVLDKGVIPYFHAKKTNTNIDIPTTAPSSETFINLVSDDIEENRGGFTLNSNDFAELRTNSRSSENRLFRVTLHAQFSKRVGFGQSGGVILSSQLRKNSSFLNDTQTHSYWHSDSDAVVTLVSSSLVELEDEDELRFGFSSNPGASNARIDYFDWTIVEVT